MGQGCSSIPRMNPLRFGSSSRNPTSGDGGTSSAAGGATGGGGNNNNASTASSASHAQTQLCTHNVCSVLRRKDWDATEKMLVTGEGMDISHTKFLERALYEGCPTRLIDLLIDKGANPAESTRCLSDAILGKVELKMIHRLLEMGCSPNQESDQDKLKRTPMHFACQTPTSLEVLDLLVQFGGDVNLQVGERMWTPVHYLACANPDPLVLKRLSLHGADVNAKASDGTTPLAVAAFKRAPVEFFRAMLEVGADPAIETRTGRNPLYYLKNNEEPVVKAGDIRLVLLDPQIQRNQLKALAKALHQRLGRNSEVRRLNPDILIYIGEFLLGKKVSKCEEQLQDDVDGGDLDGEDEEEEEPVSPDGAAVAEQ